MKRKSIPVLCLLVLVLVTLACGRSSPQEELAATEQPAAPAATVPPAGDEEKDGGKKPGNYDTAFPLPDDVQDFVGEGGESSVVFQTGLAMDEVIAFYRDACAREGMAEYELLTSIQEDGFSMVFTSWPSGEELVVQGVDFGNMINVSIRLEEVVESGGGAPAPEDTALWESQRSEMGGFAFQAIPDYTVEEVLGLVSMEAPDADPDLGPAIIMIGTAHEDEEEQTAQDLYDQFLEDADVQVSEPYEVTVGGIAGLAADVSGESGGEAVVGRVVFVAVSPTQRFTMFGAAPGDRWDDGFEAQFEGVVASISFFEPTDALELMDEETEEGVLRQWASSATASSEYGDSSWAAFQATGAPDTPECGDYGTAWASAESDTVEWLELEYDTPVYPTEVNVVQSYSPNQVLFVDLRDTAGEYHGVYVGELVDESDQCPYTLSIPVEDVDYMIDGIKIVIDQSELGTSWNEIDAVELVGYPE